MNQKCRPDAGQKSFSGTPKLTEIQPNGGQHVGPATTLARGRSRLCARLRILPPVRSMLSGRTCIRPTPL